MKTLGIVTLSLIVVSCGGVPPKMERPVHVWNGAPEVGGICRINAEKLAKKLNLPEEVLREAVTDGVECLPALDERFKEYGCMSFDDLGVVRRWEEALLNQCEKWKQ